MSIKMNHVRKKYGTGDMEVYALRDINLSIEDGEICVILGPSGSGKSTLLNMLGGLDTVDEGEINFGEEEISNLSEKELVEYRRNKIGFVFQFYNLIPDLTVEENIRVVEDISSDPLDLNGILKALDLTKYRKRFPNELSGGQQQRVAIGRAMIKNPDVLLCDELTGALDSKTSKSVLEFVEKINEEYGTTIVIITHNEQISKMASRIIRIHDGQIVVNEKNANRLKVEDITL